MTYREGAGWLAELVVFLGIVVVVLFAGLVWLP